MAECSAWDMSQYSCCCLLYWNVWHCVLVFVTVCGQCGDGWVQCLRHVTVQHRSNRLITVVHVIFWLIITSFQNNMLTCSSDLKFSKFRKGNRCVWQGGESQSVAVLSRTVELLCWEEKNGKVTGYKLAALKTNTYNYHGNKKHQIESLETACYVPNPSHYSQRTWSHQKTLATSATPLY